MIPRRGDRLAQVFAARTLARTSRVGVISSSKVSTPPVGDFLARVRMTRAWSASSPARSAGVILLAVTGSGASSSAAPVRPPLTVSMWTRSPAVT